MADLLESTPGLNIDEASREHETAPVGQEPVPAETGEVAVEAPDVDVRRDEVALQPDAVTQPVPTPDINTLLETSPVGVVHAETPETQKKFAANLDKMLSGGMTPGDLFLDLRKDADRQE